MCAECFGQAHGMPRAMKEAGPSRMSITGTLNCVLVVLLWKRRLPSVTEPAMPGTLTVFLRGGARGMGTCRVHRSWRGLPRTSLQTALRTARLLGAAWLAFGGSRCILQAKRQQELPTDIPVLAVMKSARVARTCVLVWGARR